MKTTKEWRESIAYSIGKEAEDLINHLQGINKYGQTQFLDDDDQKELNKEIVKELAYRLDVELSEIES